MYTCGHGECPLQSIDTTLFHPASHHFSAANWAEKVGPKHKHKLSPCQKYYHKISCLMILCTFIYFCILHFCMFYCFFCMLAWRGCNLCFLVLLYFCTLCFHILVSFLCLFAFWYFAFCYFVLLYLCIFVFCIFVRLPGLKRAATDSPSPLSCRRATRYIKATLCPHLSTFAKHQY